MTYLGMDIGSISVKIARMAEDGTLLEHHYARHYGRPFAVAQRLLADALAADPMIQNLGLTGSSGAHIAALLEAPCENELLAHARACAHLTPEVRTLIEIGGEDSRLITLTDAGGPQGDAVRLRDFAMNSLCAAGCGSFLDQQASRLGLDIDGEFGRLALTSAHPARIAGRCSVFAKTDMIHLQQQATPVADIVAGLCFAFARTFLSVVARGTAITAPVAFHGGVSANAGMVRAFRELLHLSPDDFIVPAHAATAGAVGAALLARQTGPRPVPLDPARLDALLTASMAGTHALPRLPDPGPPPGSRLVDPRAVTHVEAYLGVDVGSISTNIVLMDEGKRVLAKQYLLTAGRPIEAVRQGLAAVGAAWADRVAIRGVCTTGSGRYLVGDFLGADLVKNEITSQARAAMEIDPRVDTIFEIGGQDSKFISIAHGAIVDFEMNKACAAGTGSFLEEQAERLGIDIKGEFARLALAAPAPVRLGERCTVFMETDLVGFQARGASTPALAAGLAYSIVHNYLTRVVGGRKIGDRIFFQGGTAFNRAVVAAFRQVTGKPVTVPEHHEVTGALGCALLAREAARPEVPSRFKGWDVYHRAYQQDAFECAGCTNHCRINRIRVAGEAPLYYGGRCEKYEHKQPIDAGIRDLFAERDALLTAQYQPAAPQAGQPLIGIPRALHFMEYLPFWLAFFKQLGLPVVLSPATNARITEQGAEHATAEFCFPVKVAHGHALALLDAGATHLFLPSVLRLPRVHPAYRDSLSCSYVQCLPYVLRSALALAGRDAALLTPVVRLGDADPRTVTSLQQHLRPFNVSRAQVKKALAAAVAAQESFARALTDIGREVLAHLTPADRAVVIVSRPYNGCDHGVNLELPRRFRELGALPMPLDMLPVEEVDLAREIPELTWRYGQKILAGAEIIRRDPRLAAVYLTNFGCGPDAVLVQYFRHRMGEKVFLQIEVDEHASDVGALTRCEAFLDSLRHLAGPRETIRPFSLDTAGNHRLRTMYVPGLCDAAGALVAAFRAVGVPSEILPETDQSSISLAKRYLTGKECFPVLCTVGDMLRQLQQPGVVAGRSAFLIPTFGGGCRSDYYIALHRKALSDAGYTDVPVHAPNRNEEFFPLVPPGQGVPVLRAAWSGIVACELLEKARAWVRPRERMAGAAEHIYQRSLRAVIAALEAGRDLLPAMRNARDAFEAIPTVEDDRPWIGIFGEVFMRMHRFSNDGLIERLEALGAYTARVPFSEFMRYTNAGFQEEARHARRWGYWCSTVLMNAAMVHEERRLSQPWQDFLPTLRETSPRETERLGSRYLDPTFRGEAILGLGRAADFHARGFAGIVNVTPFSCMPGLITCGITRHFQQDHDDLPVLNLVFDGQQTGNLAIRLEAFMQQCRSYHARKNRPPG